MNFKHALSVAAGAVALVSTLQPAPSYALATDGLQFHSIPACRVLDTRKYNGTTPEKILDQHAVAIHLSDKAGTVADQGGDVAGCPDIPADAAAFAVNVLWVSPDGSAVPPSRQGYVSLVPDDVGAWTAVGVTPGGQDVLTYDLGNYNTNSDLNYDKQTHVVANATVVKSCSTCPAHIKVYARRDSHMVIDVLGFYQPMDASDIAAGTLHVNQFSAIADLSAEGYLGNAPGDLAVNNGALQSGLNADRLDGFHAASFAFASHNHVATQITSGTLSPDRFSAYTDLSSEGYLGNATNDIALNNFTLQSGLNADYLDGWHGASYGRRDGSLQTSLNADLLDGNHASAFATSGHTHTQYVAKTGDTMTGNLTVDVGNLLMKTDSTNGELELYDSAGDDVTIELDSDLGGRIYLGNTTGGTRLTLEGASDGYALFRNAAGSSTIIIDGDVGGDARITTDELVITGGSDLSESFDVKTAEARLDVVPGMVVSIDPADPGRLMVSSEAYDRKVAGIISGADGVKPGLIMGQEGTIADGEHPVALTGRVYCLVDASAGAIQPGDLLTTASLPGHAMKATDADRAQGAIIGKAMTGLEQGQGKVLVLVSLQ